MIDIDSMRKCFDRDPEHVAMKQATGRIMKVRGVTAVRTRYSSGRVIVTLAPGANMCEVHKQIEAEYFLPMWTQIGYVTGSV